MKGRGALVARNTGIPSSGSRPPTEALPSGSFPTGCNGLAALAREVLRPRLPPQPGGIGPRSSGHHPGAKNSLSYSENFQAHLSTHPFLGPTCRAGPSDRIVARANEVL